MHFKEDFSVDALVIIIISITTTVKYNNISKTNDQSWGDPVHNKHKYIYEHQLTDLLDLVPHLVIASLWSE